MNSAARGDMKRIERIIDTVTHHTSGLISGWAIIGVMILMMAEVITRYVLRNPLRVADEVSGYVFAFVAFIGLAYT